MRFAFRALPAASGGALTPRPVVDIALEGLKTVGTLARVSLTVTDDADKFSWDAPIWFCDPWPHPFGLAGLEGFLHHFLVTIHACDGYLEIEPEPRLAEP